MRKAVPGHHRPRRRHVCGGSAVDRRRADRLADEFGRGAVSSAMKTTNLVRPMGYSAIEWSQVETQLADLLTHDDPRSPNRATFWLTTINADGSPHVTSVGALWHAGVIAGSRPANAPAKAKNVATRPRALHDQCRHERLRRDGRRRSPAGDRPEYRGRDRGVVGEERMARAARRLGNRYTSPRRSTRRRSARRRGSSTKSSRRTATAVGNRRRDAGSTRWRF